LPRFQEHLKTGFAAEAKSAAQYRAFAERAKRDGLGKLAAKWSELAAEKDRLAIIQLEAAEQGRGEQEDIAVALAEDYYENEILYPKMIREVSGDTADVLRRVIEAQKKHIGQLEMLREELQAAEGDIVTA